MALKEALEMNCRDAEAAIAEDYEQVTIQACGGAGCCNTSAVSAVREYEKEVVIPGG